MSNSPNFPPLGAGGGGGEGAGLPESSVIDPVDTFADLPNAASYTGKQCFVLNPSGSYLLFNKKKSGYYYSDGTNWIHNGGMLQRVDVGDSIADDGTDTDADGIPIIGATYNTNEVYHYTPADIEAIATTGEGNAEAIAMRHEHDNKAILDATEAAFTTARADKLDALDERFRGIYQTTAEGRTDNTPASSGWYFRSEETQTIWAWSTTNGVWEDTQSSSVGDMLAAVYDPTNVSADVFDRANHTGEIRQLDVTGLPQKLSDHNTRITTLERDLGFKSLGQFNFGSLGGGWTQYQLPNSSDQYQFIYRKDGNDLVLGVDADANDDRNFIGEVQVYNGGSNLSASWSVDRPFADTITQGSNSGVAEIVRFNPSTFFYVKIRVCILDRTTSTATIYKANTLIYDFILTTDGTNDGSHDVAVYCRQAY